MALMKKGPGRCIYGEICGVAGGFYLEIQVSILYVSSIF
jgi:hypothetical protein